MFFGMILSVASNKIPYFVIAGGVYGVVGLVLILAIVFGLRARVSAKWDISDRLPEGFSPLDIQRVLYGITHPRRITKALLYHWANMGYIKLRAKENGSFHVRILKQMPPHDDKKAVFFDRGTYVRECRIFNKAFGGKNATTVWPNKPLLTRDEEKGLRDEYAVREDEGVYGQAHYMLKMAVQLLALVPVVLCVVWAGIYDSSNVAMAMMLIFIFIGILAMRYLKVVPPGIRYPFFAVWGGVPTFIFSKGYAQSTYDPLHIGIAAGVFLVLTTFVLIQFIDVREKNNLEEYSDIVCVKRYLRSVNKHDLKRDDFAAFLPIMYTLPFFRLYKGKFRFCNTPEWFEGERREL